MNKKKVYGLGLLLMPIGALLLTACGSVTDVDNAELGLAEASDEFVYGGFPGPWTEYGLCNDGWDNDGNGLADVADPACHVLGPVRDLSLFPAPLGHNFFPDISVIPGGGPGSLPGGFRDRDQITRWMRFLTDTNGYTAGIDLFGAAMDSPMVPVPVPLFPKVLQGTAAQGNNNNIDGVAIPLNAYIPPVPAIVPAPVAVPAAVPAVGCADGVAGAAGAPVATAAPVQGNALGDSYKPDVFQGHGRNYGHRPNDMRVDDRQTKYAPRSGMNTLGRQSNMFDAGSQNGGFYRGNNQPNAFQGRGNPAYGNNAMNTNGASNNSLSPNVQGSSLLGTDFGSPSDWPKGTTGPGYQNNSYGRQGGSYPQANQLGNSWGQPGANQLGNSWGQRGPQMNSWGQQPGANSLGNSWGQAGGYGQGRGYPQGNSWGQQGGFGQGRGYPQGNSFGGQAGYGQNNSWGGAPGGYGQGSFGQQAGYGQNNSWGAAPGGYGQGHGGLGNSYGQQAGSWPGAR